MSKQDNNIDHNATHIRLIEIIYGKTSLDMNPNACSRQAHRIANAILKNFNITEKPRNTNARNSAAESM
jgi:hypothetical protein